MKILFDVDSVIYSALYKIVGISEIKEFFNAGMTREEMEQKIIIEAHERLSNICLSACQEIEDYGVEFEMFDVEYYLTYDIFSHRKAACPNYKADRKKKRNNGNWVNKLRKHLVDDGLMKYSLRFEADDLIYDRAVELNYECIVCTVDKDLNQIKGWKFDLYREFSMVTGQKEFRGMKFIEEDYANTLIWKQMLEGDKADNIEGIKGIGKVKATKMIEASHNPFITVARLYKEKFGDEWKEKFKTNHLLLKLGSDGVPEE